MERNLKIMKIKKYFKLILLIFFYLGIFNAISNEQDITLNNPTSFPVDI
tara:strand:- start:998 stop:1144 length:147 start_codon:yes stop_codon:yes gene_type:complete